MYIGGKQVGSGSWIVDSEQWKETKDEKQEAKSFSLAARVLMAPRSLPPALACPLQLPSRREKECLKDVILSEV